MPMTTLNQNLSSINGSLTSEPDSFSDEAWNLLLETQDVARQWRHEEMDVEHLLQVLFSDRAYTNWVELLSIDSGELLDRLEAFLAEHKALYGKELESPFALWYKW